MCSFTMEFIKFISIVILPIVVQSGDGESETIVPKNMNNCDLRHDTMYSWLVRIWDNENNVAAGHGSLLTVRAVLSSCTVYKHIVIEENKVPAPVVGNYKIIGQSAWNQSDPSNLCSQTATASRFIKHPKCIDSEATFFNFGIWILEKPFRIIGTVYPTFRHPVDRDELLTSLQFIDAAKTFVGCDLPYFPAEQDRPSFDLKSQVQTIPWRAECIKLLCEKNPADEEFSSSCEQRFGGTEDGSLLCMYPTLTETIPPEVPDPEINSWYAGAPLVCNDTVYGIASQVKYRNAFPTTKQDFHLVSTLLRVWAWLMEMESDYSHPSFDESELNKKPPPSSHREGGVAPERGSSPRSDSMMMSCTVAFIIISMPRW